MRSARPARIPVVCGVDDYGDIVSVCDVDYLRERRVGILLLEVSNRGRVLSYRFGDLPRFDAPRPGAEVGIIRSDIDKRGTCGTECVIVSGAVGPGDEYLISQSLGIR